VSPDIVIVEREGRIAILTLNRPGRLNAISRETIRRVQATMDELEVDDEIAVVILRGAGRAFSSGMDLKDDAVAGTSGADAWRIALEADLAFLMRFWEFPKPTLAVVHGFCLAAACELAMCCDIRIASDDAQFGLPEVSLGYIPSAGGTQTLPRHVPSGLAMQMILTGDPIDAPVAIAAGLVQRVVPRERLYAEAETMAEAIAARPAEATRLAKRAIVDGAELSLASGMALESTMVRRSLETASLPR